MLRVLIRCLLCASMSLVVSVSSHAVAGSGLPSAAEIKAQRDIADDTLKNASSLATTRQFLQDIARNQQSLQSLAVPQGDNTFHLPENEARADLQALWQQAKGQGKANARPGIVTPVIFVSFSLPETKLQELLAEADRMGALVVLRGLINDDINATLARISDYTKSQKSAGIVLDPTLFSRFDVNSVPAFLLPVEPIPPCDIDDCKVPKHVMASGSVSLFYFLDLVKRTGDVKEQRAAERWLANYGDAP